MEFDLSEEAGGVRDLARTFADRELRQRVAGYRGDDRLPPDLVTKMAELGMLGGVLPERWGGSAMSHESLVAMVEELSTVDHVMAGEASQASAVLGSGILTYGSDAQREKYVRPLCLGEAHGSVAMSEPQGGSAVADMKTRARSDGGDYVLDGQKIFVSHFAHADFFLTFAQTDPGGARDGICAFIVDKDSPGLAVLPIEDIGVIRPHSWGQVFFEGVRVPREQLVGEVGDGLRVAFSALELGRMCLGARAVGAARQCVAAATAYAGGRSVGGTVIGHHQHIQKRLADMLISIAGARLLVYQVAASNDESSKPARVDAAIAKLSATTMLERVASETIDIFGGYGLTTDYPWGQYLKDAKALQIGEGTREVQYSLIAETMLGLRKGGVDRALRLLDVGNPT